MEVVNKVFPSSLNVIMCENMLISNPLLWVRYRQERRLLLKLETCRIFKNLTALTCFSQIFGSNTTDLILVK